MNLSKFNSLWNKILALFFLIFSIIYFIVPIDFVPDVAPVVGWADDIFFGLYSVLNICIQWRKKHQ